MLKTISTLVDEIKTTVSTITAQEAVIKCTQLQGVTIDVREPAEVQEKSAKGTINIPRGVLEMKILPLCPDNSQAIFIHCASGVRALFAAEQLMRLGYKNVWAISCKIDDVCQVTWA